MAGGNKVSQKAINAIGNCILKNSRNNITGKQNNKGKIIAKNANLNPPTEQAKKDAIDEYGSMLTPVDENVQYNSKPND